MRVVKALVLIAVVALALPQLAAAADSKNEIGVFVGYVSPTGDLRTDFDVPEVGIVPATVKAESAMGYGLAYQYRFSDMFSLGASVLFAKHDIKIESAEGNGKIGDTTFMPVLFDGNFHVLQNAKTVDFYLGPTVGYAFWGDLKPKGIASDFDITGSQSMKNKFVYGANFGLDVPFKDNWAFNANARYLLSKAEPDVAGAQTIDVNPWLVTVGVSYKF